MRDDGLVPYDGIVLAGGRARRLGGLAKPALEVRGRRLIDVALQALDGAVRRLVVGGEQALPPGVLRVHEEPRGGGPVAAVAAALPHLTSEVVVLLAGDLPFVGPEHVRQLVSALGDADAAVAVDDDGRRQPLLGAYRREPLARALPSDPAGAALRSLDLQQVVEVGLAGSPAPWFDCDTPADLALARRLVGRL